MRKSASHIASMQILPLMIAVICAIIITSSCSEEKKNFVDDIENANESPTMLTRDVETFISDSGITRYRITADIWYVYDEAKVPRWTFPQGLFLEQFDNELRQNSKVNCDSATYFSEKKLWRLDGDVVMVNVARDSFLTKQLYWDQRTKRIYSDTAFIRIVSKDRTIEGYGFSSNEQMTDYSIKRPTAIFSATNLRKSTQNGDSTIAQTATSDSISTANISQEKNNIGAKRKNNNLKVATVANDNAIFD